MRRVHGPGYGQVISAAVDLIPPRLHSLIQPDYLCGADPVFVGLHRFDAASYNRSYRHTAHVAYSFHQQPRPRPDRVTTVVLPTVPTLTTIVHELGHVLDETLGFTVHAHPVSWYADDNRAEAFAEAFTSWVIPGYAQRPDPDTTGLLDSLTNT